MAQTGYTPILCYASGTPGNTPLASNMTSSASGAELAINYADGKLFYKDSGGTVQVLAVKMPSGILPIANGGTNATAVPTAGAVAYGTGTAYAFTSAGTSNQVLISNGSSAPSWSNLSSLGVTSLSFGTTGLTPSTATQGAITVAGTLATTNGGTGLTSFTANGVLYASSTSALTSGSALTFDGTTFALVANSSSQAGSIYSRNTNGGNGAWSGLTLGNDISANKGGVLLGSSAQSASGFFGPNSTYLYNTDGLIAINAQSNNPILFGVNNSEQMRLTSTGLGIGTSSPIGKLQVKAANPQIYMEDSAAGTNGKFTAIGTSNGQMTFSRYLDNGTLVGQFMTLDAIGNLGLGVAPSAWASQIRAMQVYGGTSYWAYNAGGIQIGGVYFNAYNDGTAKYSNTNRAASFEWGTNDGAFKWLQAGSGTAGNAISFTQAMTLDASGRVQIGTTSSLNNSRLTLWTAYADAIALSLMRPSTDVTGGVGMYFSQYNSSLSAVNYASVVSTIASNTAGSHSGTLVFETAYGGSLAERARIDSSGHLIVPNGVTLGTAVGTYNAANTLNDYEEGTWTPSVEGSSVAGSCTYSTQSGRYTKIGNIVVVHGSINFSAHTGTGSMYIRGLPFTSVNAASYESSVTPGDSNITTATNTVFGMYVLNNTTTIRAYNIGVGATASTVQSMVASGGFWFTLTYQAA